MLRPTTSHAARERRVLSTIFVPLALVLVLASGCKQSTEPTTDQGSDSQAAADLTATALGTSSGGSGMVMNDVYTLISGGTITDGIVEKGSVPQSNDTIHTVTVTRSRSWGVLSFQGSWTHTWTFYDANGVAMPKFVKGQTDKIVISSRGQHTVSSLRVSVADSSLGSWTITNIIASPQSPTMNGTLTRAGSTTLHTARNNGRQMTHSFTINWTNDQLLRDTTNNVTYLLGSANSDFKAVNFKGNAFERKTDIQFHGDGTATLNVTRTSGDGKVDTFTVDVKRGIWLRDDHIG